MVGNGDFLEKSATFLEVVGQEGVGCDLATPLKLRGFLSTSSPPRDAAVVDAAIEATYGLSDRSFHSGRAGVKVSDNEGCGEQNVVSVMRKKRERVRV